jgi:hypothetical protein
MEITYDAQLPVSGQGTSGQSATERPSELALPRDRKFLVSRSCDRVIVTPC